MTWLAAALLGIVGAWMLIDGSRALLVGDYFTPREGDHAGQLGPWSRLVEQVGISPRSTPMKAAFVVMGALHLAAAATIALAPGTTWAWIPVAASITGLWYLPIGTILDLGALVVISIAGAGPWT